MYKTEENCSQTGNSWKTGTRPTLAQNTDCPKSVHSYFFVRLLWPPWQAAWAIPQRDSPQLHTQKDMKSLMFSKHYLSRRPLLNALALSLCLGVGTTCCWHLIWRIVWLRSIHTLQAETYRALVNLKSAKSWAWVGLVAVHPSARLTALQQAMQGDRGAERVRNILGTVKSVPPADSWAKW